MWFLLALVGTSALLSSKVVRKAIPFESLLALVLMIAVLVGLLEAGHLG